MTFGREISAASLNRGGQVARTTFPGGTISLLQIAESTCTEWLVIESKKITTAISGTSSPVLRYISRGTGGLVPKKQHYYYGREFCG